MNFSDRDLHRLVRPEQVSTWVAYLNSGSCKETRSIELRNKLVEMNLGLIDKRKSGEEHYGKWAESLIVAVERFDPSKGYTFSTFAVDSMGRGQRKGLLIAVPNNVRDHIAKIKKALATNPDMSVKELALKTNLSPNDVRIALEASRLFVQGLRKRGWNDEITEIDPKDPEDNFVGIFEGCDLQGLLTSLTPGEKKQVMKLYNAMKDGSDLGKAARKSGISKKEQEMLFRKIRNSHRRY